MADLNRIFKKSLMDLTHERHGGEIHAISSEAHEGNILDYSTNINPLISTDIFKNLLEKSLNSILLYPDSNSTTVKNALVKYFGNSLSPDNLLIGAGSMELIRLFCDMFLVEKDEVIVVHPTFTEYDWAIKRNNCKVVNAWREEKNDFLLKSEKVLEKVSSKTKIIIMCNPNNPNGALDDSKEILTIIETASEKNILVFLDEAFIEFTGEHNSFKNKINQYNNIFIARSFTKFFGLPGLRIGFGISTPEIIQYLKNGQELWPVNCIAQECAQHVLNNGTLIEKTRQLIQTEKEYLLNFLNQYPDLKIYPSDSNFFLINTRKMGITARSIKNALLQEGILIRDCSNYKGLDEFFFRISIKERESNEKLIMSLKNVLNLKIKK
ncbi:MAG: pyridoxal phosphate-dependent aminotransferase [Promethearchaeota archaeon]